MQTTPLTSASAIQQLDIHDWQPAAHSHSEVSALEQGKVLFLPELAFSLNADERPLIAETTVEPQRKNISFNPQKGRLTGVAREQDAQLIKSMMLRHYQACCQLVAAILPEYQTALHSPINTLRLHPVKSWGAQSSWRKDDSRLHVDAFPSRPNHGERILRLFTNINPQGVSREWRVGEPFPQLAKRFYPRLKGFSPLLSWLQQRAGITKSYRSHYDALMLQMHDEMKADGDYQRQGRQLAISFPAGSSWLCFSDQTPHAAMAGQYMLEQTWFLPVEAMQDPQQSPLRVLERLAGKPLI